MIDTHHIELPGEQLANGFVRSELVKLTDLSDSQLGVTDQEMARLIHISLSRYIGGLDGWRGMTHPFSQTLAGVANLSHAGEAALVPPPGIPLGGFSAGRRVMKANGLLPLELNNLWGAARGVDGDLAMLPLDLVTQFVHPALWPMLETSIRWGPAEFVGWLHRYFLLAAQGAAPNCGQLSSGTIALRITACWRWMQVLKEVRESRLRRQLAGDVLAALEDWDVVPKKIDVKTLGAKPAQRDRTAPELEAVRRAYHELEQRIARKRKSKQGQRTLFGDLRDRAVLHLFCLGPRIETIATMRVEDVDLEGNRIRLRELKGKRAETAEGIWKEVHPKLIADLREFIQYAGVTNSNGHTPLHRLDAQIYGAGAPASDYRPGPRDKVLPLWVKGRLYFNEETGEPVPANDGPIANWSLVGRGIEARPNPEFPQASSLSVRIASILEPYTGASKSGHTLRHLAEQLAQEGAHHHLEAHDEPAYITEEVIAAALLDRRMPGGIGATVYTDVEGERPRLAQIAAYAISDYVTGDRGAKLGLDEDRIISSRQRLQEAEAELKASKVWSAALEQELASIGAHEHPLYQQIAALRDEKRTLRAPALDPEHTLTDRDYRRLEQELEQLDDELDELRDKLTALQGRLAADIAGEARVERDAAERLHRAHEALRQATEARLPLPPGQEPGDLEARLRELLGEIEHQGEEEAEDDEPVLVRDWLTVKEYALVMGIPHSTMRRYIRDALASADGFPFAGGASNHRNPWFQPISKILDVHGPRMRRFSFETLDLSRYTPGQTAAMKQLLSTMPATLD